MINDYFALDYIEVLPYEEVQESIQTKEINANSVLTSAKVVQAGMEVLSWGGASTISFIAERGNDLGYVISGHAAGGVGTAVSTSFGYSGNVVSSAGYSGTTDDAAFVKLPDNGSVDFSFELYNSNEDIYDAYVAELPVGSTVFFSGKTSGLKQGKVISSNVDLYYGEDDNRHDVKNQCQSNISGLVPCKR